MGLVNSKTKSKMNKRLLSNSPGPLWFLFFFFFQNCSQSINNLISQIPTHPRNKSFFPCLNISRYCWFSSPQSPFLSKAPFSQSLSHSPKSCFPKILSDILRECSISLLPEACTDGKHSTIRNQ